MGNVVWKTAEEIKAMLMPPHEPEFEVVAPFRPRTAYLSGPISSNPHGYREVFAKYAAKFRAQGYLVISPAELDGDGSWEELSKRPYRYYLERDIRAILNNDVKVMFMLPGWEQSRGAKFEKHLAEVLGIEVFDAETEAIIP